MTKLGLSLGTVLASVLFFPQLSLSFPLGFDCSNMTNETSCTSGNAKDQCIWTSIPNGTKNPNDDGVCSEKTGGPGGGDNEKETQTIVVSFIAPVDSKTSKGETDINATINNADALSGNKVYINKEDAENHNFNVGLKLTSLDYGADISFKTDFSATYKLGREAVGECMRVLSVAQEITVSVDIDPNNPDNTEQNLAKELDDAIKTTDINLDENNEKCVSIAIDGSNKIAIFSKNREAIETIQDTPSKEDLRRNLKSRYEQKVRVGLTNRFEQMEISDLETGTQPAAGDYISDSGLELKHYGSCSTPVDTDAHPHYTDFDSYNEKTYRFINAMNQGDHDVIFIGDSMEKGEELTVQYGDILDLKCYVDLDFIEKNSGKREKGTSSSIEFDQVINLTVTEENSQ